MAGRTSDGKRLSDIVSTLSKLPGVSIEEGTRHPYLAKFSGTPAAGLPGNCAIATSTSYERHIVPWVKKVTGYEKKTIESAFKKGYWDN
ncbi:MAG: hypothetical protein KKA62_04300 [Nanoarchaeota archaeon]|nr:hypothetical protein [Nanoarchaeota archaeon]MBU1643975.1 hypothetical protein [Nanoarchaeota archaeon]MBU1977141.1 hypothetical protein [Nanoarchaeota archaeon]